MTELSAFVFATTVLALPSLVASSAVLAFTGKDFFGDRVNAFFGLQGE